MGTKTAKKQPTSKRGSKMKKLPAEKQPRSKRPAKTEQATKAKRQRATGASLKNKTPGPSLPLSHDHAPLLSVAQLVDVCALLTNLSEFARTHSCPAPSHLVQCAIMIKETNFIIEHLSKRGREHFGNDQWEQAIKDWRERIEKSEVQVTEVRLDVPAQADPSKLN